MNNYTRKSKGTVSVKKDISKPNDNIKKSVFQKYRICYNSGSSKGKKELNEAVRKKKSDKQETQKIKKKEKTIDKHFNNINPVVSNNVEETNEQKLLFNVSRYYEKVKKWNLKRTEGVNCEKKALQNTLINQIKKEKEKDKEKEKENLTNAKEIEHHTYGKRKFNNYENKNVENTKKNFKDNKQIVQYKECVEKIGNVESSTCVNRELKYKRRAPKDTGDNKLHITPIDIDREIPKIEVNLIKKKNFFASNELNCLLKNENTQKNEEVYSTNSQHSERREQETMKKKNSHSKKSYETILHDIGKDLYSNKTFMNSNDNFDISNYILNNSNCMLKSNQTYINNFLDIPTIPSENESEANSYSVFLKQEHAENQSYAQTQTKAFSDQNVMHILPKRNSGKLENMLKGNCSNDIKEIRNFGNKNNTKDVTPHNLSNFYLDKRRGNKMQIQWHQDTSEEFLNHVSFDKTNNTINIDKISDTTPKDVGSTHAWGNSSDRCKTNMYNERIERILRKPSVLNDYENARNPDVQAKDFQLSSPSCECQELSYENGENNINKNFEENSFEKLIFKRDTFKKNELKSELYNSSKTKQKKGKTNNNEILQSQEHDQVNVEKETVIYKNITEDNDIKKKIIYNEKINKCNISTHNIVISDEKERLIKTKNIIMNIREDPLHDLYDTALELEVNTHKKLIEIPTKKIENNFDILLCLLMKNEQKESFMQCLLLDKELTEHSHFFQTQIKPIFEDYKKAKFQKIKERNSNANINDYNNIKPNKIVLQILTTTINHKYLDHIAYLYNIKKEKKNWKATLDMERGMKELNKKLRNKEIKTVGITNKWRNSPAAFIEDYETKIKLIEKPHWSNKKHLEELLKKQQNYNPFTIFGTSIKEVNLEEIFTLDVYNNYVTNEDRYKNKILYELYCRDHINNLFKQIEPFEWKIVINTLQKSWKYFINLECNMSLDPLLLEEILWYIDINKMYKDQSKKMFIYETCFCPTPDPTRTNNLNDFKNFAISMDTKCVAYSCRSKKKHKLNRESNEVLKKKKIEEDEDEDEEEEEKEEETKEDEEKEKEGSEEKMEWNVEEEDWEILENNQNSTDNKWAITYNDTKEWKNKKRTTTKQLVSKIPRPSGSICYYSDYFQSKILKDIVEQIEMYNTNTQVSSYDSEYNNSNNNDKDNNNNNNNNNNKNESPPIPKSSRVVEDVFLKNNDTKEWTSQNFFDNFFFNYYLYNFDRCNCKYNSIL